MSCLQGGDKVWEPSVPGAPPYGKNTIIASTIGKTVGSPKSWSSVVPDQNDTPWFLQWKCVVFVLEKYRACSTNFSDNLPVVSLDVDMLVVDFVVEVEFIEADYGEVMLSRRRLLE